MVRHVHEGDARQPPHNWGLLLLLGLCAEFWIIVTTAVAENL
jgi:hypothetical protein